MGKFLSIVWALAVVGLAFCLLTERHACLKLAQQNMALHLKLSPLDGFIEENRRLSNLLAQASYLSSRPNERRLEASQPTDEETNELQRLRAEVDTLRQQTKEIESLREDTRQARAVLETNLKIQTAGNMAKTGERTTPGGSQLQILKAEYWTDNARMDVTDELRDRIRGDSLKAVASDNIKGDPGFGQVKHLTIEYQFGGVTMTNEFREGDIIVLPRE